MTGYIVTKNELLIFLEATARLDALEQGGVDNWSWYSDALHDFLKTYAKENPVEQTDDFDFLDIAQYELQFYRKVDDIL